MTASLNTIEITRAAKARLEGGAHFEYGDWCHCNVGHLYQAATGRYTNDEEVVLRACREELRPLMDEVGAALGNPLGESGHEAVDLATYHALHAPDPLSGGDDREVAIAVLDRALTALEAQQEADRLDVLSRAREVVDGAVLPVEAVA